MLITPSSIPTTEKYKTGRQFPCPFSSRGRWGNHNHPPMCHDSPIMALATKIYKYIFIFQVDLESHKSLQVARRIEPNHILLASEGGFDQNYYKYNSQ